MAKSDIEKGWEVMAKWTLEDIMKFRARFIHACYKAILPPEVYALAKDSKEMGRCQQWAKDNGWQFMAKGQSLLLLKDGNVLGEFRPELKGGREDPHLEFYAQIAGVRMEVVREDEQNPGGIQDLIRQELAKKS